MLLSNTMMQTLQNFDILCEKTPIHSDNISTFSILTNQVNYSTTKYVRYHFLWDRFTKAMAKNDQSDDIFTRPLAEEQFNKLRRELGICNVRNKLTSVKRVLLAYYQNFMVN